MVKATLEEMEQMPAFSCHPDCLENLFDNSHIPRQCAMCQKQGILRTDLGAPAAIARGDAVALITCERCKVAVYCSKTCQKKHSARHRFFCSRIGNFQAELALLRDELYDQRDMLQELNFLDVHYQLSQLYMVLPGGDNEFIQARSLENALSHAYEAFVLNPRQYNLKARLVVLMTAAGFSGNVLRLTSKSQPDPMLNPNFTIPTRCRTRESAMTPLTIYWESWYDEKSSQVVNPLDKRASFDEKARFVLMSCSRLLALLWMIAQIEWQEETHEAFDSYMDLHLPTCARLLPEISQYIFQFLYQPIKYSKESVTRQMQGIVNAVDDVDPWLMYYISPWTPLTEMDAIDHHPLFNDSHLYTDFYILERSFRTVEGTFRKYISRPSRPSY